jgi:hypothetical protein
MVVPPQMMVSSDGLRKLEWNPSGLNNLYRQLRSPIDHANPTTSAPYFAFDG